MVKQLFFLFAIAVLGLSACGALQVKVESRPSQQPAPALPTETPVLLSPTAPATPTATPDPLPIATPEPGTVVLDFVAQACAARWANGAYYLPCPGNPTNITQGYIAAADHAMAEGGIPVAAPVLIGLPGIGSNFVGGIGGGLFGNYPPITIQSGDTFHAVLACQDHAVCDVSFALNYFDANGNYHHEMNWLWAHHTGDGPTPVQVDLSPLAGQTVRLVLAIPIQNYEIQYHWILWINPYVSRTLK